MTTNHEKPDELLVPKLESLARECLSLRSASHSVATALADLGILPSTWPPRVSSTDRAAVVRLKEEAIALHGKQEKMIRGILSLGAIVLDRETMELVMPGGPEEGSVLSWQPGEVAFLFWRPKPDTRTPRRRLPGTKHDTPQEALH